MAKITITIEDKPGNLVEVISTPSNESLLHKIASIGAESLTSAEAYSLFVCRQLREESKRQSGRLMVLVPPARKI
jgi:hypothetical protein